MNTEIDSKCNKTRKHKTKTKHKRKRKCKRKSIRNQNNTKNTTNASPHRINQRQSMEYSAPQYSSDQIYAIDSIYRASNTLKGYMLMYDMHSVRYQDPIAEDNMWVEVHSPL